MKTFEEVMASEHVFLLLTYLIIAAVIISVAWAIAWESTIEAREAIAAGYVQVEVPRSMMTKWVKP